MGAPSFVAVVGEVWEEHNAPGATADAAAGGLARRPTSHSATALAASPTGRRRRLRARTKASSGHEGQEGREERGTHGARPRAAGGYVRISARP
jgi:hypothetical protein